MHTVTGDFMDSIRENFFAAVEPEPEAAPGLSAEDIDDMSLDEFGERREVIGIRHQASDFIGLSETDDGSGFPSWRHPTYEEVVISPMDTWREERTAAGVPNLNDFGLPARPQRVNASPWSVT